MPWTIVLPLLLLAALVILLLLFLQRAGRALAQVRQMEGYQREAADLAARMDDSLRGLIERVDAVRRHEVDPGEVLDEVEAAIGQMETFLQEARAIKAPPELAAGQELIAADLNRGLRALEMIRHGTLMTTTHLGRAGELEAQTSVKRGYLNLLHARDAVLEHTTDLAEARDATANKWRTSRI
jgi:hypothetical protein